MSSWLLPFPHFNPNCTNRLYRLQLPSPPSLPRQSHQSIIFPYELRLQKNSLKKTKNNESGSRNGFFFVFCCSTNDSPTNNDNSSISTTTSAPPPPSTTTTETATTTPPPSATTTTNAAPLLKRRKRYRKLYPGESKGIVEEMRFVAMKLRNENHTSGGGGGDNDSDGDGDGETWQPSIEGFLKYLVNSKLVFQTLDHIVDESDHVAYAYFRKTGLERTESLSKDLEWFHQQDIVIPQPSSPGVSYAKYLEELAEKSAPLFLCHFYNIYFAHISGGQVITKQVSEKLLEGKELEFNKWEGDVLEMLKDMREKLNMLGEHWSRDEKNKCLREAAKSYRSLGQIVRLIIL